MRANVPDTERRIGRNLTLDFQCVRKHSWRESVRLYAAWRDQAACRGSGAGHDLQTREGYVPECLRRVEGSSLVKTVIEIVEQGAIDAESGMNDGFRIPERGPG